MSRNCLCNSVRIDSDFLLWRLIACTNDMHTTDIALQNQKGSVNPANIISVVNVNTSYKGE